MVVSQKGNVAFVQLPSTIVTVSVEKGESRRLLHLRWDLV